MLHPPATPGRGWWRGQPAYQDPVTLQVTNSGPAHAFEHNSHRPIIVYALNMSAGREYSLQTAPCARLMASCVCPECVCVVGRAYMDRTAPYSRLMADCVCSERVSGSTKYQRNSTLPITYDLLRIHGSHSRGVTLTRVKTLFFIPAPGYLMQSLFVGPKAAPRTPLLC